MTPRRPPVEPVCGKGTMHGQVAMASPWGFAKCQLAPDHRCRCDSGDAPTIPPDLFDPRRAA